jgi:hypothetical protein
VPGQVDKDGRSGEQPPPCRAVRYQPNVMWSDSSTEASSGSTRPDQIGLICAPLAIMLGGG